MKQPLGVCLIFLILLVGIPIMVAERGDLSVTPTLVPSLPAAPEKPGSRPPPEPSKIPTMPQPPPATLAAALPDHFTVKDLADGSIRTLEVADYLRGAITAEMPMTFPTEALLAQGIASHSWAQYSAAHREEDYDFTVNTARDAGYLTRERFFERYGDAAPALWTQAEALAARAARKLLTYDAAPALAVYHAISNGSTERAEAVWQHSLPYLVSVESPEDLAAPQFEVVETFDEKTMRYLLLGAFPDISLEEIEPEEWMLPAERVGGYVQTVAVGGTTQTGIALREALRLRSTDFTVQFRDGTFSITTRGYGHGVGMSQRGAEALAEQGATAAQILAHYYPGTQLIAVTLGEAGA